MIEIIRNWCEGIIIAIIISVIIELLVPEGNNKKYVKVVVGIYIIFVIINPLLNLVNYEINLDNFIELENTEEVSSELDSEIKDVYILGIEQTIKNDIENLGYIVKNVKIKVDNNYENIESIEICIQDKINNETIIEPVIIGEKETQIIRYEDIITFLEENYLVNDNQIIFK